MAPPTILSTLLSLASLALLLHPTPAAAAAVSPLPPPAKPVLTGQRCPVTPLGAGLDDAPQILAALTACSGGGTVVFAAGARFAIRTALRAAVHDVKVEWGGVWVYSDDRAYWRANSFPVEFQNHAAGFVLSGERIHIDGGGTGGIEGGGDGWYAEEKGSSRPGRPMPFVLWDAREVVVERFFVKQPQLWAINIMNGTNMAFDDIYVNATALSAPYGKNWVQNTDGFDTMDAHNISLTNFVYQGMGDDAVAIKPRSYNIYCQNLTIHGGNGIAIGSLGQYLEDSSVVDVVIRDVKILTYNDDMHNSAYIKTWIGEQAPQKNNYESAGLPRGGGWGEVKNILIENFYIEGAGIGPNINQDSGNNGSFAGTSNMLVSNVTFANFTGFLASNGGSRTAQISCSSRRPCRDIEMRDIRLRPTEKGQPLGAQGSCKYIEKGGVRGMTGSGCS